MLFTSKSAIPLIALLATNGQAWSTKVHNQIAFMAESFLTPQTTRIIKHILEPQYDGSIGRAAAWADEYGHTDEGKYSSTWHYINPADSPPAYCNVYYNRDCTEPGCIVQAIANATVKFESCVDAVKAGKLKHGSDVACSMSLKFLAHFIGDITQPLHTTGVALGGNAYPVTFGGKKTNLHSVWDTAIIMADAKVDEGFSNKTIDPYFSKLLSRIKKDNFFIPTHEWLECTDPSTPIACALAWARDSNALTCDYVFSQVFNGTDLLESGYASGAFPIVQLQVSKSALRLATWLNRIVGGWYKDREVILQTNPSWLLGPTKGK
ncbi:hypothetical protein EMCG_04439 [[Emmonsia] crescens]|uniref:Nuclease PA3 n=1 Tax=[Emmonsia] crescens TaxID=73230 RepID=A0A0G2IYT5_9EURO|nr:hypothetical protein EMCG_04439 [Emmonsia crescens UAMH 3008]